MNFRRVSSTQTFFFSDAVLRTLGLDGLDVQ
jgi:hypothetical protein